jgi:hypothetical protein
MTGFEICTCRIRQVVELAPSFRHREQERQAQVQIFLNAISSVYLDMIRAGSLEIYSFPEINAPLCVCNKCVVILYSAVNSIDSSTQISLSL